MRRHWLIYFVVYTFYLTTLCFGEGRKMTQDDIELGPATTSVTSTGGHVGKKVPRYWDNNAYVDNLTVFGKGFTGDNTGRVQGASIGSASYTDNGFLNYLRAKYVYDNNALRVDDPQFGTITFGLSASTAQRAANTLALQAAIDAAGEKALRFPGGIIAHDGLSVTKAVLWQGSGWDYPNGTVLAYFGSDNGITFVNASEIGFVVRDMCIMGSSATPGSADNTTSAVMVHWESGGIFENVYFWNTGGYGALLLGHTSSLTFKHCKFQHNRLAGIYGRSIGTAQLNKIDVLDTDIRSTYSGHGLDVWGTVLNFHRNTLQSTDNACISLDATDTVTAGNMNEVSIRYNYFEACKGGSIWSKTSADHLMFGLDISNNWTTLDVDDPTDNTVVAHFTFTGTTGQYYNARLGPNTYLGTMTYFGRFDNTWDQYSSVDVGAYQASHFAKFLDLLNLVNGAASQPRIVYTGYGAGAGSPPNAPKFRGEWYLDTTNFLWYRSYATTDNTYWQVATYKSTYGAGAPSATPVYVGAEYRNTSDNTWYKAHCVTDNTCWKALN